MFQIADYSLHIEKLFVKYIFRKKYLYNFAFVKNT